ncbi:MAG: glycoside hydrolase family 9 protein, partial [Lachnospiraceae bacterium]|nr:glycoside hydrolase family 9 protein [Lachnospiraceae bacterium]
MICFNQSGYLPDAAKIAVLTHSCDTFSLEDAITGQIVYTGKTKLYNDGNPDEVSGDIVYHADFSAFREEGKFILHAGELASSPFFIGRDVYRRLKTDLIRSYYFQRCGCALDPAHAGKFTHGCCHTAPAVLFDNPSVELDLSGGWHDAGDYGRYVTAAATALAHLLYAFALFPDRFLDPLNLPETGNGTPDLLNECRYELEWLLKMQRPDGGVFHKVSTWHHAPFIMPELDSAPLYAYAVSTPATADFSAVTALASRIYAPYYREFSEKLGFAAKLSWIFLEIHPELINCTTPPG